MQWEELPTDYEDVKYRGRKKYDISPNDDGTVCIRDVTEYENIDKTFFGAIHANRISRALNYIMKVIENDKDNLIEEIRIYFDAQKVALRKRRAQLEEEYKQALHEFKCNQTSYFRYWFNEIKDLVSTNETGKLARKILDTENELMTLNHMCASNKFEAFLAIEEYENKKNIFTMITDDNGFIIIIDWRYNEEWKQWELKKPMK